MKLLLLVFLCFLSVCSATLDHHVNMARKMSTFWNKLLPKTSYHGEKITRFEPEWRAYWEAVSIASLVPIALGVLVLAAGLCYLLVKTIRSAKHRRSVAHHPNAPPNLARLTKPKPFSAIIIVICVVLIVAGSVFGFMSNKWYHDSTITQGIRPVVRTLSTWKSETTSITSLTHKLNITNKLPSGWKDLTSDVHKIYEKSKWEERKIDRIERVRNIYLHTFFSVLVVTSLVTLLLLWRYSKALNFILFWFILLGLIPLMFFWIGTVQQPSVLVLGNLCTHWDDNYQWWVHQTSSSSSSGHPLIQHYLTCHGKNPLASLQHHVNTTLGRFTNETNQTNGEMEEYKSLEGILKNYNCTKYVVSLAKHEKYQICTRAINNGSVLYFVHVGLIIVLFILLLGGLKLKPSLKYVDGHGVYQQIVEQEGP